MEMVQILQPQPVGGLMVQVTAMDFGGVVLVNTHVLDAGKQSTSSVLLTGAEIVEYEEDGSFGIELLEKAKKSAGGKK